MRSRRTPATGLAKTSDSATSGASEGGPEGLRRENSPGDSQRIWSRFDQSKRLRRRRRRVAGGRTRPSGRV